jgi:hypothetical protein
MTWQTLLQFINNKQHNFSFPLLYSLGNPAKLIKTRDEHQRTFILRENPKDPIEEKSEVISSVLLADLISLPQSFC